MQRECHQSSRSGSSTHAFSTHLRPTFVASEVPDEYAIYPREKQYLLALHVTPAVEQDRAQAEQLAQAVQDLTDQSVTLAYVDQGCTGANAREAARAQGIALEVVKHTEAKRGFILLPRRWVVERSFAWAARFRRLARDYERLAQTLAGFHYIAFACLMLHRIIPLISSS